MPQSFACVHYHLIFSTKNRRPWIVPDIQHQLYQYIGGIVRNVGGDLLAAGGMPDHVQLLVRLDRTQSVADALRAIKANSSRWVHESSAGRHPFAWQAGYAAFAISYSHLPDIQRYLDDQATHHQTTTFQEEYLAFLKRHNLMFDERFVWD